MASRLPHPHRPGGSHPPGDARGACLAFDDAGVRAGLKLADATALVLETLAGSAELLRANDGDTLAVRRGVTSPGGTTARGLRALTDAGLPSALHAAMDATRGTV